MHNDEHKEEKLPLFSRLNDANIYKDKDCNSNPK